MSDWKRVALALADAFAVAAAKAEEDRGALIVERVALRSELRESRAETEDARRRCAELEQELETAREARDILLKEAKEWRENPGKQTLGMANLQAAALRAGR